MNDKMIQCLMVVLFGQHDPNIPEIEYFEYLDVF